MGSELDYDFVDFGSGFGGCIDFAKKKLGGKQELGIEHHAGRCKDLVKCGYNCINRDVSETKLPPKSVNFVTISHVLEHLNNKDEVGRTIDTAVATATKFVFIEGPTFDFDSYLDGLGLKFMWRDGHGHHTKVKVSYLLEYIKKYDLYGYSLLTERPYITNSMSADIHPASSPPSVNQYDPEKHPPKESVGFDKQLYRSFILFLWLQEDFNIRTLLKSRTKFEVLKEEYFDR